MCGGVIIPHIPHRCIHIWHICALAHYLKCWVSISVFSANGTNTASSKHVIGKFRPGKRTKLIQTQVTANIYKIKPLGSNCDISFKSHYIFSELSAAHTNNRNCNL